VCACACVCVCVCASGKGRGPEKVLSRFDGRCTRGSLGSGYDVVVCVQHPPVVARSSGLCSPWFYTVIGRDEEIRRTIQVLSRRTKNNPVLIGEPGVGKTALAEGLALRSVA
jgi:hypothetical protein